MQTMNKQQAIQLAKQMRAQPMFAGLESAFYRRVYRDGRTQLMELPDLEELGLEVAA